jgi:nucleoside-diphosphate-sugar epimerase
MQQPAEKVLITGAAGWLGKRLSRLIALREIRPDLVGNLPRSLHVRVLILPNEDASELQALGVEVIRGDLRNPGDCQRFCEGTKNAVLLHTAGVIHPRRIKEFYEVNTQGTKNVLAAAVKAELRRAVVVSSNSPFGMNPTMEHRFDESAPYRPYMNYGRSKMQMELVVKETQRAGRMETVVLRAPWFYGPGQPPRQTLFFSMIRAGRAPIVGSGDNLRSMAYIDNLCEASLLAAFVERANGQTYWIADKRPYSMNEIIDVVEGLLEREFHMRVAHKRVRLPNVVSTGATLADHLLQGLGIYNQKIHVLSEMNKTIACTIKKAETDLGYDPQISLEEGMRRSVADCFARGMEI